MVKGRLMVISFGVVVSRFKSSVTSMILKLSLSRQVITLATYRVVANLNVYNPETSVSRRFLEWRVLRSDWGGDARTMHRISERSWTSANPI
jgi:hypothetical protein